MTIFSSVTDELLALDYDNEAHSLDVGVIASYYNVFKYPTIITKDYIHVSQRQRDTVFLLSPDVDVKSLHLTKKGNFISIHPYDFLKKKSKEVAYNLKDFFDEPNKVMRRGVAFKNRQEVTFEESSDPQVINYLFDQWKDAKIADPKVFKMTFNPGRYQRSYDLKRRGFDIYQKVIRVRDEPYGLINFSLNRKNKIAFELSFVSLFYDKEKKLINDQNDCIIISALHDLYQEGIEKVNLGTAAGIKGLSFFKHKFPYHEIEVLSS